MAKLSLEARNKLHFVAHGVRLAYPKLFEPETNTLNGREEFSCQIRFYKSNPEHMKQVEQIRELLKYAAKVHWGDDAERNYRSAIDSKNTRWLREDDEGEYFFVSLKRRAQDGAPRLVHRDRTIALRQEDGKLYSGVIVNAVFDIWCYSGVAKNGQKIPCGFSATLGGVQFVADADPLGGARVAKDDDFEDLGTDGIEDNGDDFF